MVKTLSSRNPDLRFRVGGHRESPGHASLDPTSAKPGLVKSLMRPTIQTKQYALAGTTEWRAIARLVIPLDDPDKFGNCGMQGSDEDTASRTFKSKASAVRWRRTQAKTLPNMQLGEVIETYYDPDEFDDREYGRVLDAIQTEVHIWNYYVGNEGALHDDGDWRPNG